MLTLALNENNRTTAEISFPGGMLGRFALLNPSVVDITHRFAPERSRVENFIRAKYADAYDARIAIAYPTLMSVRHADGTLLAAAGFRHAADEPLFLEQYTGAPVEAALSKVYGAPMERSRITEIGNLVSAENGASIFLYATLASYLHSRNIGHAVVTGTGGLHRQFVRLGLDPQHICDADSGALKSGRPEDWGRYYETHPRVLAGSVADSVACLKQKLGAEYREYAPHLRARLHYGYPHE